MNGARVIGHNGHLRGNMSPAWFWLVIAVEVNVTWIAYDVWAVRNGHNTLSRQMHDWIF